MNINVAERGGSTGTTSINTQDKTNPANANKTTVGHFNNRSIFRVVDSPKATLPQQKILSRTPSPTIEQELAAAHQDHYAALKEEKEEKKARPILTTLFGAKATARVREAAKKVALLSEEKKLVDQAVLESKETFRKWVRKQGGNPDIAEEVFEATLYIPDCPTAPEKAQQSSRKSIVDQNAAGSNPSSIDDIWHDVDPDADQRAQEAREGSSLSVENFQHHLALLNEEEIANFIHTLSPQDRITLAKNYFHSSLHDNLSKMSTEELNRFLISTFAEESNRIQQETPLILRPRVHEIISNAFLKERAPIEHQGLRNGGVDCYLSSALQCVRQHFSNLPSETQQALLDSLRMRYNEQFTSVSPEQENIVTVNSPLVAFLEGKFDGRDPIAASFLRLEVRRVMQELAKSGRNSSQAAREIANGIDLATGNSQRQCDSSEALIALMEYLGTPRIETKEIDTYLAGDAKAGQLRQGGPTHDEGNLLLPFGGMEEPRALQEVIRSNFINDLTGAEAIEDPDGSKHDIHRERQLLNPPESFTISLSRFRMKPDPAGGWATNSRGEDIFGIPKLAFDQYGRSIPEKLDTPIAGLVDPIILPVHEEEGRVEHHVAYTPTSIICHYGGESANSGHYATYCKEGEEWFLMNDALVMPVDLDATMHPDSQLTHRQFLEQNAYILNYRKVE